MRAWGAGRLYADGSLPAPSVYGVPDCWPHVRGIYERAGFAPGDRVEIVLLADVARLPGAGDPPLPGLTLGRALGGAGTRFTASLDGRVAGIVEARSDLTQGGTLSRLAGFGELWEL
jgi:hypothetical protein